MKNVAIIGASGSIGSQTIDVLKNNKDKFKLVALSVGKNIDFVNKILTEFPEIELVSVQREEDIKKVKFKNVVFGQDGLVKVSTIMSSDILITAVVGSIGLMPTIKAIESRKNIALANKETLVTAGHIIMPLIKKYGVKLLPVDSEHSAIFQALKNEEKKDLFKLIITASGGSFRDKKFSELKNVSKELALKHPNWSMGAKITIDSATMFNKGLEVIEAHHLFDVSYSDIEVVIHRESVVHSMVEFVDGSVIAQLGTTDMRLPIQYALTYPDRNKIINSNRLDLKKINTLHFEEVDKEKYEALFLAIECGEKGNSYPTVLNAANEEAVNLFLTDKIKFLEIVDIVKKEINKHKEIINPTLDEIITIDTQVRENIKGEYS